MEKDKEESKVQSNAGEKDVNNQNSVRLNSVSKSAGKKSKLSIKSWTLCKVSVLWRSTWGLLDHRRENKHYIKLSFQKMMIHFLYQHQQKRIATTAALSWLAPWFHPTSPVTNRRRVEGTFYLQQEVSGHLPQVFSKQVLSALLPRWGSSSWLCLIWTRWINAFYPAMFLGKITQGEGI